MGCIVKKGKNWMFRYYFTRATDGKRVENMRTVCLISQFPSEKKAWEEVKRKKLDLLEGATPCTFGELIEHYKTHELDKSTKAKGTIYRDKHNLDDYVLPRWGTSSPSDLKPLDIEDWLRSIALQDATKVKLKIVMGQVFKHSQRHGLIPRDEGTNPMTLVRCAGGSNYEAVVLNPEQIFKLLEELEQPEYTIALLIACTGLRQSEAFALQWGDLDFERNIIHVRRSWTLSEKGKGKTKLSKSDMPMHPTLAEAMQVWRRGCLYSKDSDWVFASVKCMGRVPRCGSMAAQDYLRPAAVKAGILTKEDILDLEGEITASIYRDKRGDVVTRFGWHNLRHSLSSFLVAAGTDPKTVQSLLRHANVQTTLDIYSHANSGNKMAAQGEYLAALAAAKTKALESAVTVSKAVQ